MPEAVSEKLVIVVDLVIDGDRDRFMELMAANAAASLRDEPGCRQFDVCVDADDPGRLMLYEVYDDEAAFAAHGASPHYQAFDKASAQLIARKDVRRLRLTAG